MTTKTTTVTSSLSSYNYALEDAIGPGSDSDSLSRVASPHGASVSHRQELQDRYHSRMSVGAGLTRGLVSYQGNKAEPGLRWMKYKEGFTRKLVEAFVDESAPESVLDPFAGVGTAPLTAAGLGAHGVGIEVMPVGVATARALDVASNGLDTAEFASAADGLLDRVSSSCEADSEHRFKHVRITDRAFSASTESDLAKAREFISQVEGTQIATLLDFACMSVLEEISYTRKDGQYLRWDYRSGRKLRSRVDKGPISTLSDALDRRLRMMLNDIGRLGDIFGGGTTNFVQGSCLRELRDLDDESFDMVFTSPPYANRYDYTRTYALELAWLGLDQAGFSRLRQELVTATVENRPKRDWLNRWHGDHECWALAVRNYDSQSALHEVVDELKNREGELSNRQVIRLIEGYFLEMAYVIAELSRVTRPGGEVVMVNDNVQYHGEQVPVDLILSDMAEKSGFECENIWMLPRGKGNSSQQMGRYGRTEIRKCVYRWRRRSV